MNTKQVIVMRKDLRNKEGHKIRTGKFISQGAHASMGALLKFFRRYETSDDTTVFQTEFAKNCVLDDWLNNSFTKITLAVDSEADLIEVYEGALALSIPAVIITDNGLTEFGGVPTKTCVGIGPYTSEDIDKITSHLKLF